MRLRVPLSSLRPGEEEEEGEREGLEGEIKKLLRSGNLSARRSVMMSVFLMARRSVAPGWAAPPCDTANQSTRGGFGVTTRIWLHRRRVFPTPQHRLVSVARGERSSQRRSRVRKALRIFSEVAEV